MSSFSSSGDGQGSAAAISADAAGDPSVLHLLNLARSGVAVPEALEAAAAEVPGLAVKRTLRGLADRIRRGESLSSVPAARGTEEATAASENVIDGRERLMATVAAGPGGVVGSVGAFLAVQETIGDMRRQLGRVPFLSIALILAAVAVGYFVMLYPRVELQQMFDEFDLEISPAIYFAETVCFVALGAALLLCLFIGVTYRARRWPMVGGAAEMLVARFPLLGSTMTLIDLAEMTDAMARLLAAQRTYPEALTTVQSITVSPRLRRWLGAAGASVEQGARIDDVFSRLPWQAGLLTALVGASGPAPDRPAVAWRIAADTFLRDARQRAARAIFVIPPFAAVIAGGLAWGVMTLALSRLSALVGLISGLG